MRKIYRLRSRLMPYIYSLAYGGYADGEPMIASMYLEYPENENAYRNPQQYRFGKAFLCAPVTVPADESGKAAQSIWIPDGVYYHFFTEERYGAGDHEILSPLDEFPLFVKAGVPIPMQAYTSRMTARTPEVLTIRCYAGDNGDFTLYEDDGVSSEYENGAYLKTRLIYKEENRTFSLTVQPEGAGYAGMPTERSYVFELIGAFQGLCVVNRPEAELAFDGKSYTVCLQKLRWDEGFTLTLK
jgi:alpha-glucosidase (family GH31 glycosyl hydrolase)